MQDLQRELDWLVEAVDKFGSRGHWVVYSMALNSLERLHGVHAKPEEEGTEVTEEVEAEAETQSDNEVCTVHVWRVWGEGGEHGRECLGAKGRVPACRQALAAERGSLEMLPRMPINTRRGVLAANMHAVTCSTHGVMCPNLLTWLPWQA